MPTQQWFGGAPAEMCKQPTADAAALLGRQDVGVPDEGDVGDVLDAHDADEPTVVDLAGPACGGRRYVVEPAPEADPRTGLRA